MLDSKVYESFMTKLVKEETQIIIFLLNGVKLQGIISSFDDFGMILKRNSEEQFVYRNAVSTVAPLNNSSPR